MAVKLKAAKKTVKKKSTVRKAATRKAPAKRKAAKRKTTARKKFALSVSISTSSSPTATSSPTDLSQDSTMPSSISRRGGALLCRAHLGQLAPISRSRSSAISIRDGAISTRLSPPWPRAARGPTRDRRASGRKASSSVGL